MPWPEGLGRPSGQGWGLLALALALAACQGPPGPTTGPKPNALPSKGPAATASAQGPSADQASPSSLGGPAAQASVAFVGRPQSSPAGPASTSPSALPSAPASSPSLGASALPTASPTAAGVFAPSELDPPAALARVVSYQEPGFQGLQAARSLVLVSNSESPPGGLLGPQGGQAARRLLASPSALVPCGLGGRGKESPARGWRLQAVAEGGTLPFTVGPGFGVPDRSVTARAVASGAQAVVLLDVAEEANPTRHAALVAKAQRIVAAFDGGIHARDTALFGAGPGAQAGGDARLHVVVSSAVDNGGKAPIPAYFSPADQGSLAVIHVAVSHLDRHEADLLGTVAHEYQHLINHHHKVRLGGAPDLEDLWIDEGLAMLAMQANGYGFGSGAELFQHQAVQYLNEPGAFSLSEWGPNPEGRGYGGAYFFFQYLSGRFGEGLIRAIVTSPQRGVANLDARLRAQGSSFKQAFTDFAMASLLADRGPQIPAAWSFVGFRLGEQMAPPELPRFAVEAPGAPAKPLRPLQFRLMALPAQGPVVLSPDSLPTLPPLAVASP